MKWDYARGPPQIIVGFETLYFFKGRGEQNYYPVNLQYDGNRQNEAFSSNKDKRPHERTQSQTYSTVH
jgi:hypothetical protein